jgi:septal ring factor EnvC (AmiA/AmiB activator)
LEHEAAQKVPVAAAPKVKKEKPKGGTKDSEKQLRRLEREIEKQETVIADLDAAIEAAAADYQELTRLLGEKEQAEAILMELMESWEAAGEELGL